MTNLITLLIILSLLFNNFDLIDDIVFEIDQIQDYLAEFNAITDESKAWVSRIEPILRQIKEN